jgi:hypothetical protein
MKGALLLNNSISSLICLYREFISFPYLFVHCKMMGRNICMGQQTAFFFTDMFNDALIFSCEIAISQVANLKVPSLVLAN